MKLSAILVFLVIFPSLLMAQTPEQIRRIEQEKREALRPTEARAVKEKKASPPPLDPLDLIYFAELMLKKVAFRYDACKALVLLVKVENQYIDLGSQITFLREKKLLPKRFEKGFDPAEPLRRGLTAYMFSKVLDIRGGILLTLLGPTERYALKELVHQGIMASGNVKDILSGEELVSILTQAGNYMSKMRESRGEKTEGAQ